MIHAGWQDDPVIRGASNALLHDVRSLQRRKARSRERAFVVEGSRAVSDALLTGAAPRLVLLREGTAHAWRPEATPAAGARTVVVDPRLFDGLTETIHPQGIAAVFPFPDLPIPPVEAPLYLVADGIRDPGNLGTLLRAAVGAGVTALYVTPGTVDLFNPKVVRAAMGAHFRVPILPLGAADEARIMARCRLRAVTDAAGEVAYDSLDWTEPAALVVGSEAVGAGQLGRKLTTVTAAIPLAGGLESLNAAVAGAVVLFEAARQRRSASGAGWPGLKARAQPTRPLRDR